MRAASRAWRRRWRTWPRCPTRSGACGRSACSKTASRFRASALPLGVVAVVYEARPNVTADAAGICLKSGNAAVLRGGSMAAASNEAIARVLHDAATAAGMPRGVRRAGVIRRPRGGRRAHGAARGRRRAHPAGRGGAHPPLRGAFQGAGHRDGHGQLPRVRARDGRCGTGRAPSCSTRSAAASACATRPRRCWLIARSRGRFCPRR